MHRVSTSRVAGCRYSNTRNTLKNKMKRIGFAGQYGGIVFTMSVVWGCISGRLEMTNTRNIGELHGLCG